MPGDSFALPPRHRPVLDDSSGHPPLRLARRDPLRAAAAGGVAKPPALPHADLRVTSGHQPRLRHSATSSTAP